MNTERKDRRNFNDHSTRRPIGSYLFTAQMGINMEGTHYRRQGVGESVDMIDLGTGLLFNLSILKRGQAKSISVRCEIRT